MSKEEQLQFPAIFCPVPALPSFYLPHEEQLQWRRWMLRCLSEHPHRKITLVSEGPRLDDWQQILTSSIPRTVVERHLIDLRRFLAQLYAQRHRLSWVATGEVSGSYFELALCVSQLQVVSPWLWLGFPAWEHGYAPVGGSCEMWVQAGEVRRNFWQSRKIFFWQALHAPSEFAVKYIAGKVLKDSLQRSASAGAYGAYSEVLEVVPDLRSTAALQRWCRPVLKAEDQRRNATRKRSSGELLGAWWEVFWKKTQLTAPRESRRQREMITEEQKVRLMYLMWREASLVSSPPVPGRVNGGFSPSLSRDMMSSRREIWVDVTRAFPPVGLVALWWSLGWQLVCFSSSASLLARRLQIFTHQIIHLLGKEEGQASWQCLLHACVGSFESFSVADAQSSRAVGAAEDVVWMTWLPAGEVRVRWRSKSYLFWRQWREEEQEDLGWVEGTVVSAGEVSEAEELRQLGGFLGAGVVKNARTSQPLCLWLRAQLLVMLVRESTHVKGGWRELMRFLTAEHWRIPEETKEWAQLMRRREWVDDAAGPHEAGSLFRELWDASFPWGERWEAVAQWRQRMASATESSQDLPPRYRVDGLMSQHFLLFALFLVRILVEKGYLTSTEMADEWVREVLGVPLCYGSLFYYGIQVGEEMFLEHSRRHFCHLWPGVNVMDVLEKRRLWRLG